jgi:hypothetical protein
LIDLESKKERVYEVRVYFSNVCFLTVFEFTCQCWGHTITLGDSSGYQAAIRLVCPDDRNDYHPVMHLAFTRNGSPSAITLGSWTDSSNLTPELKLESGSQVVLYLHQVQPGADGFTVSKPQKVMTLGSLDMTEVKKKCGDVYTTKPPIYFPLTLASGVNITETHQATPNGSVGHEVPFIKTKRYKMNETFTIQNANVSLKVEQHSLAQEKSSMRHSQCFAPEDNLDDMCIIDDTDVTSSESVALTAGQLNHAVNLPASSSDAYSSDNQAKAKISAESSNGESAAQSRKAQ